MSNPIIPVTNDTPQLLLEHHLKLLRLPTFLREYDKVARQCADSEHKHELMLAWKLALLTALDTASKDDVLESDLSRDEFNNVLETEGRLPRLRR